MKVLYVEDNVNLAFMVKALLEGHNYDVVHFALGKPALERFLLNPEVWDAAILDLDLPDMAGQDLIPQISGKRPNLPIIVYTGAQGIRERFELYSAGASALMSKPSEGQDLLDVLEGLIERPPEPIS